MANADRKALLESAIQKFLPEKGSQLLISNAGSNAKVFYSLQLSRQGIEYAEKRAGGLYRLIYKSGSGEMFLNTEKMPADFLGTLMGHLAAALSDLKKKKAEIYG